MSLTDERIVINKDSDFIDSYYFQGRPAKYLIINTVNIRNNKLFRFFIQLFTNYRIIYRCNLVEVSNIGIIRQE
jgi:predicted nuclease of predicted toxin-antitoxin system